MQNPERDELEKTLASLGTGSGLKLRSQLEPIAAQIAPELQRILEDSGYCEYLWQRFGKASEGQKPQVEFMGQIVEFPEPITRDSFEDSLKSWAQALLLSVPQAQEEPLKSLLRGFLKQRRREAVETVYYPKTGKTARLPLSSQQDRWMAYTEACEDGDLEAVKTVIESGIFQERKDAPSCGLSSALMGQLSSNHYQVAEFLQEQGADIEVEISANRYEGLLHFASSNGDLRLLQFLLRHGAKVDGVRDLKGLDEFAASLEDEEERQEELAKLADENYFGLDETPLICAAMSGHEEIVKLLIETGANIHAWCDSRGTALDCAEPNVIEFLKQHGAKYHYGEQTD